jgi:hypothetical protein
MAAFAIVWASGCSESKPQSQKNAEIRAGGGMMAAAVPLLLAPDPTMISKVVGAVLMLAGGYLVVDSVHADGTPDRVEIPLTQQQIEALLKSPDGTVRIVTGPDGASADVSLKLEGDPLSSKTVPAQ